MSAVCIIQHVAVETPGLIAGALKAHHISLDFIRPFAGERIPRRIGDHAGLVVMGGPMGVDEQGKYPFLRREIHLIQDALSERRPVLGICLGSQLLAAALGASVMRGRQKEIGWHSVTLNQATASDALWRGLPKSFTAFHWHGDVFQLPHAATSLASSRLTEHQAFCHGESAYGLLFHLEMTEQVIRRMTRMFRGELHEAGLSERPVLDRVAAQLPALHTIGRAVFGRWAALVNGQTDTPSNRLGSRIKGVNEPPAAADDEPCEPSSPPCYLSEFKDQ